MARFSASIARLTAIVLTMLSLAFVVAPAHSEDEITIKLEMKDGVLTPNPVEVPAKKAFRLEIKNTGKTAAEFESKDLRKEKVVAPGVTAVVVFRALEAGEYAFIDEFHEDMTKNAKLVAK